jgi:hypothetical protein
VTCNAVRSNRLLEDVHKSSNQSRHKTSLYCAVPWRMSSYWHVDVWAVVEQMCICVYSFIAIDKDMHVIQYQKVEYCIFHSSTPSLTISHRSAPSLTSGASLVPNFIPNLDPTGNDSHSHYNTLRRGFCTFNSKSCDLHIDITRSANIVSHH